MHRLSFLILLLGALASLAVAATAPTFCKCTCFTNSTIIEIKPKSPTKPAAAAQQQQPPGDTTTTTGPDALSLPAEQDTATTTTNRRSAGRRAQAGPASGSCSQCNRSFCLSQSLPICRGAADKDVSTMCFQRDSRKDQVIVWGFILGTAGLLGWAAAQRVLDMRSGGGLPGVGGGTAAGAAGGGVLPLGRGGGLGSTGTDGGRGAYAAVAGHSRESSLRTN